MSDDPFNDERNRRFKSIIHDDGTPHSSVGTKMQGSSVNLPSDSVDVLDSGKTHRQRGYLSLINFQDKADPSQHEKAFSEVVNNNQGMPKLFKQLPYEEITSQNFKKNFNGIQFDNFSMGSAWKTSEVNQSHSNNRPPSPLKKGFVKNTSDDWNPREEQEKLIATEKQVQHKQIRTIPNDRALDDLKKRYDSITLPSELLSAFDYKITNSKSSSRRTNPMIMLLFKGLFSEMSLCVKTRQTSFAIFRGREEVLIDCEVMNLSLTYLFSFMETMPTEFWMIFTLTCEHVFGIKYLKVLLLPFGNQTSFDFLNSERVHKMVRVHCLVIKVCSMRVLVSQMDFKCADCSEITTHTFVDFAFEYPKKCSNENCDFSSFIPLKKTAKPVLTQRIRVQELQRKIGNPGITQIELREDFINELKCGDHIDLIGILRPESVNKEDYFGKQNVGPGGVGLYSTFIEVLGLKILNPRTEELESIQKLMKNKAPGYQMKRSLVFSEDMAEILKNYTHIFEECVECEQALELLIHYFAPGILQNEIIKAFLVLCMFSPEPIHLLILGPSISGRTTLLSFMEEVGPHTIKGKEIDLFPKLTKEPGNEFSVEPGKIALCDQGVCCIDDIGLLPPPAQSKIIDVIDNRKITIGKAGSFGALSCNTSFIASAAIKEKTYDKRLGIKENSKMSDNLIPKFDFVLVLKSCSGYMLNQITQKLLAKKKLQPVVPIEEEGSNGYDEIRNEGFTVHIRQRIREFESANKGTAEALANIEVYKAFVSYLRSFPMPKVNQEVACYMRDFYIELRDQYKNTPINISLRLYFTMIKLVQSRARIDNRESVSIQHANEVVEMIKEIYGRAYEPNSSVFGTKTRSKTTENSKLSNPKKMQLFLDTLKDIANQVHSNQFQMKELKSICDQLDLALPNFPLFIDKLNIEGLLIKKPGDIYELTNI